MHRNGLAGLALLGIAFVAAPAARGDEFDRLEGPALAAIPESKAARPRAGLTIGEIDGLPTVFRDTRSAVLVVKTDQGNFSRLLVVPALRKAPATDGAAMTPKGGAAMTPKGGGPSALPVLLIERFDTFESGNLTSRLARGKDVILFDGFQIDLDSGQIVPEGQGGDLQYVTSGPEGPRLRSIGKATLFTLAKAPASPATGAARPSLGRTVLASDFAGRYRLFANGQWSGTLDLKVDADGTVSGRFRSDLNGTSYPVNGQVAADVPQKIAFSVKYPRTRQDFEGLLWTEGKGAMAGSLTMLDRAYGFFALREGGRFAPEGEDVGPLAKDSTAPGRRTVSIRKGEYTLDGTPRTDLELTDALKKAVAADATTWVLLQVPEDEPYSSVLRAFETLGAAGVATIRLSAAAAER